MNSSIVFTVVSDFQLIELRTPTGQPLKHFVCPHLFGMLIRKHIVFFKFLFNFLKEGGELFIFWFLLQSLFKHSHSFFLFKHFMESLSFAVVCLMKWDVGDLLWGRGSWVQWLYCSRRGTCRTLASRSNRWLLSGVRGEGISYCLNKILGPGHSLRWLWSKTRLLRAASCSGRLCFRVPSQRLEGEGRSITFNFWGSFISLFYLFFLLFFDIFWIIWYNCLLIY